MATLKERLNIGKIILEQHFDVTILSSSENENSYFEIIGKEMSPNQGVQDVRIALKDFQIKQASVFKQFIPVHCPPTHPTQNLEEDVERLTQDLVSPTPRDLFATTELLGSDLEILEFLGESKGDILHSHFRYLHLSPATRLANAKNQSLSLLLVRKETRCCFKKISNIPSELRHNSGHKGTCDLFRFSNSYGNIFRKATEVVQEGYSNELDLGDEFDLFSCISLHIYGSLEYSDFIKELVLEYEGTKDHEGIMANLIAQDQDNEQQNEGKQDQREIDEKKQAASAVEKHMRSLRSGEFLPGDAEIHILATIFNTKIYVSQHDNTWGIYKPFSGEYKMPFSSTIELQVGLPFHFTSLYQERGSCRCSDASVNIKGPLSENLRNVDRWVKLQREVVPCCVGHQHLARWDNETSIQPDQKRGEINRSSDLRKAVQRKLDQEGRCLEQARIEEETLWQTLSLEIYGCNVNDDFVRRNVLEGNIDDDDVSINDLLKKIWDWLNVPVYVLHVMNKAEMVWKAYGGGIDDQNFHCRFYITMAFFETGNCYERILPKKGCNCMFLPPLLEEYDSIDVVNGIKLNVNTMHIPLIKRMTGNVELKSPKAPRKSASTLRAFSELILLGRREDMKNRLIEEMDKYSSSLFRCISREIVESDEYTKQIKALVATEIRDNPEFYSKMIPERLKQTFSFFTLEGTKHKEHADILASRVEQEMDLDDIELYALSNCFQVDMYILSTFESDISSWRVIRPSEKRQGPKTEHGLVSKCGQRLYNITLAKSSVGAYCRIIPRFEECNCQMVPPVVRGSARALQTLYPDIFPPRYWVYIYHGRACEMDILKVRKALDEWLQLLEMFQEFCNMTIENLELTRRNVNIAAIAGSATGIVGAGLAITGAILAPVTFGASLGLTIAGASVGAVGGATSIGSKITEAVINKNPVKTLQRLQSFFEEKSKLLEQSVNIMLPSTSVAALNPNDVDFHAEGFAVPGVLRTAKSASTIPLLIARSSVTVASTVAFVLGPLSALIDVGLIVVSALNLKSGSRTLVTENLRGLANLLRFLKVQMETELFGTDNYN